MSTIAALAVSFRSADEIAGMAATLDAAVTNRADVDLYVIENSDDAAETAQLAAMPGVHRLVPNDRNLGYGGGVNAMVRALDREYDWLLICNPDIRFEPGSLDVLTAAGDAAPHSGLLGPQIRTPEGEVYPSARAFPSLRTGTGHALFGKIWPGNPWTRRYKRAGMLDTVEAQPTDWLSGACLLVRPAAFTEVHGFDEGYFMYFEDVDLALRMSKAGWGATWVPTSVITHSGAHSTKGQAKLMRRVHHQSARRYVDQKYRGPVLAPLRGAIRVGLFVRSRLGR
jgi:N-acetylglucosaminyl-diphospho-decaprenol L-rhamnosyltransferase